MPPRCRTASGHERRVGVELELNGMDLGRLTRLVASTLGGIQGSAMAVEETGRYERRITGDAAGDWTVEIDFRLLKELGRETRRADSLLGGIETTAENLLAQSSTPMVPLEVISPPLPLGRLQEVQTLIEALRDGGALGTSGKFVYAFGMQFNPEVPDEEPATLRDYLRAFLCLYDWLDERAEINFTRRLTNYIDPFPKQYIMKLMPARDSVSLASLIDDYLHDNPTRNRALDMLPVFSHLDETRVRSRCRDQLIKARPTFHYRLPNSEIDEPGWGMHHAWNDWVEVERLAEDKTRLNDCCHAYLKYLGNPFHLPGSWLRQLRKHWLQG